jgi:hypothetical protein
MKGAVPMPSEKMDRELQALVEKLHRMKQEVTASQESAGEIQTSIDQIQEASGSRAADPKSKTGE